MSRALRHASSRPLRPTRTLISLAALALVLSACGGVESSSTSATADDKAEAGTPANRAVTTAAAVATTSTVVVRARGMAAGGVAPTMVVRVAGAVVATQSVATASTFTNYSFTVPTVASGAVIDVAFTNDAVVGTEDRNLVVESITVDGSTMLSTDSGVKLDKGDGAAAFDGVNVIAGQAGLWWNGALRYTYAPPASTVPLVVRARGMSAGGVAPLMSVRVAGQTVASGVSVSATTATDFIFNIAAPQPGAVIDVVFTNDGWVGSEDRNLIVESITVGGSTYPSTGANVQLDKGTGAAAFDGLNVIAGQAGLWWDGALRFTLPGTVVVTGPRRYVRTTGADTGDCKTQASPCRTIAYGVSQMASGDTLIVGNGTYHEDRVGQGLPHGHAGPDGVAGTADDVYTTLQAESDFGVEIIPSTDKPWNKAIYLYESAFVKIQGLVARGNQDTAPMVVEGGHHIKILRGGFSHGAIDGNAATVSIGPRSDYVLMEENYAFGGARYQFLVFESDHTVMRRNVARNDYYSGATIGIQSAAFTNYDSVRTSWQNNIAIDSSTACCTNNNGLYAAFFNENKVEIAPDTSEEFLGNIVLNFKARHAAQLDDRASGLHVAHDNIYWDSVGGYQADQGPGNAARFDLKNLTVGQNTGVYYGPNGGAELGAGASVFSSLDNTLTHSIFVANQSYGVTDYVNGDYNAFYANGANYGGRQAASPGAHDLTTHNVLYKAGTNPGGSLKYLPRGPEAGSVLAAAGSGGQRIGAQVMWKIGVDGTLYGEPGWNTVRDATHGYGAVPDRLWPFPNEARIKSDMASYQLTADFVRQALAVFKLDAAAIEAEVARIRFDQLQGTRGFASSGKQLDGVHPVTLSSYVWEYLGNPMPASLY